MARSFMTAGLALSWMLSPDALVLLGNSVGQGGLMFFVTLVIGVLFSTLAIALIHHPAGAITTDNSFTSLAEETGFAPAMTLTLAGRLCPALLLPTGMLVTAGFSFNETFIYWFPNFAFSFLLLAIVLTLHLLGDHIALAVQPFFVGLTMSCLLLLCLAGLFGAQELQPIARVSKNEIALTMPLIFTALLLVLGYDQVESSSTANSCIYLWTLPAGAILLALWAFVSLRHVPETILAKSTIPNIISAREILGQPGRIIMSIAIISGTFGVVNGLFLLAGRSLQQITDHLFLPSQGNVAFRKRIWPVVFSLCIGSFMATGLAGNDNLQAYIYGALLFWLLLTGMHCFAATETLQKQQETSRQSLLHRYLVGAVFPFAAVWLVCINERAVTLVVFCFVVLGAGTAFSTGWLWYDRKTRKKSMES